jgi:hypothetical protein
MINMPIHLPLSATKNVNSVTLPTITTPRMMNNTNLISSALLIVAGLTLTSGCKKMVHQNIQAASNSSIAIIAFNDAFEQLNAAVSSELALDQMTQANWNLSGTLCATVTLAPLGAAFPKTLTIDYGNGCIGPDGVTRTGKIVATFSGNFREEGTAINLIFDGYLTGQYALAGSDSITNNGTNGSGDPQFSEVLRDVVISWGTQQILWEADLNRTWTDGSETNFTTDTVGGTLNMAGLRDDVFELTGSASGNDANTHPFSLEIATPLVLQTGCGFIQQGTLTVSPANFDDGAVDYGTGECDRQATVEVNGEVFNFTL